MRTFRLVAATSVVAMAMMTGCGSSNLTKTDANSVTVKNDGSVVSVIFDDFSAGYYNLDELKTMADDEVNAYNAKNGEGKSEVSSIELKDSNVKMIMKFASAQDYSAFNSEQLLYGTVSEIKASGITIDSNLVDKDGVPASTEDIAGITDDQHVLVTAAKGLVALPYSIKYISKGATVKSSQVADLSQTAEDEPTYIVLGK